MKTRNLWIEAILFVAVIALVWMTIPPDREAEAQYGPHVAGSLQLKRFNVVASSSGANTLIAAVSDKRFRIVSMKVTAQSGTAVNAYFYNGDNELMYTAAAPQPYDMTAIAGLVGEELVPQETGWLETDTVNEAFAVNLSGAVAVAVVGTYVEFY